MQGAGRYTQRVGSSPRAKFWKYDGWPRGENSFSEDNEIRDDEFYELINGEIIGKASIRLPRRGCREFASIPGGTDFNGWGTYKDPVTGVNVMIVQISGRVYKITTGGIITEIDNTKTWDETARMRGILLRGFFYFGNKVDYMAKTDGSTIVRWNHITAVTFSSVARTGTDNGVNYEYGITAVTENGETEISNTILQTGPSTLDSSNYLTLTWVRKTDADVKGYNIYKGVKGGTMTLLTFVDQAASGANMTFADKGVDQQSLIYEVPTFNTTGGVKGNIWGKYANTLFVAGNDDEPDTVFYGGTGANWESFSPSANGGWVKPGRGDGEEVTAMIGFEDFLFIFKETSIWKFVFGSDGGPALSAVIPQYGTKSPDSVQRFEKDIMFLGSDGRYRILGYEPSQLNVIRTTDISNRIQLKIDALNKSNISEWFATVYDQKYILCDGEVAYSYDRRYIGFLGKWSNYNYDAFLVWDKGTNQQKLFGIEHGTGKIVQLLVDDTYDDDGDNIDCSLRVKRVDGGEDTILKYFFHSRIKFKYPRGKISLITYKDGSSVVDTTSVSFAVGGGIGKFMFDEAMFDQGVGIETVVDAIQVVKKLLEFEAYSIYHQINITGNQYNHCIVQTMSGMFEVEDIDYERDELIV